MAQVSTITLNFDSHITEVKEGNFSETVTTSGQSLSVVGNNTSFTVTLTDGFVLDTVTALTGTITNVTNNSFDWAIGNPANDTITLTSKVASVKESVDLTTLSGWANLSAGNHTIKIKAKGTGYKDSELSAGVTVSKAASTVTLEAGTYKFIESPQFYTVESDEAIVVELSGKMNTLVAENTYGEMSPFSSIIINFSPHSSGNCVTVSDHNGNGVIGSQSEWNYSFNEEIYTVSDTTKLRTIIVETDQQVSPEFYNWAITQGNLVKQSTGHKLTLTSPTVYSGPDSDFYIKFNGTASATDYDIHCWGTGNNNPPTYPSYHIKDKSGNEISLPKDFTGITSLSTYAASTNYFGVTVNGVSIESESKTIDITSDATVSITIDSDY